MNSIISFYLCFVKQQLVDHAGKFVYNAGMKSLHKDLQYTIRGIDAKLDQALRAQARRSGASLNQTALDALRRGAGVSATPAKNHDFDQFFGGGFFGDEEIIDTILAEQRQIDAELWQ